LRTDRSFFYLVAGILGGSIAGAMKLLKVFLPSIDFLFEQIKELFISLLKSYFFSLIPFSLRCFFV